MRPVTLLHSDMQETANSGYPCSQCHACATVTQRWLQVGASISGKPGLEDDKKSLKQLNFQVRAAQPWPFPAARSWALHDIWPSLTSFCCRLETSWTSPSTDAVTDAPRWLASLM